MNAVTSYFFPLIVTIHLSESSDGCDVARSSVDVDDGRTSSSDENRFTDHTTPAIPMIARKSRAYFIIPPIYFRILEYHLVKVWSRSDFGQNVHLFSRGFAHTFPFPFQNFFVGSTKHAPLFTLRTIKFFELFC